MTEFLGQRVTLHELLNDVRKRIPEVDEDADGGVVGGGGFLGKHFGGGGSGGGAAERAGSLRRSATAGAALAGGGVGGVGTGGGGGSSTGNLCAGLPERDVIGLGLQVLDALRYAHGLGIVHRNLSPREIFLSEWREPGVGGGGSGEDASDSDDAVGNSGGNGRGARAGGSGGSGGRRPTTTSRLSHMLGRHVKVGGWQLAKWEPRSVFDADVPHLNAFPETVETREGYYICPCELLTTGQASGGGWVLWNVWVCLLVPFARNKLDGFLL